MDRLPEQTMDDDSLIQTIDRLYFEDEETFKLDHLTNELPADLTSAYLLEYRERLEKLLTVVTRKVSQLILSHQPTYVDELQRIANLQKSLTDSIRVCTQGRSCLRFIKEGTIKNGTTIIEHYKKRESLAKFLESLQAISDLKSSVSQIRGLVDNQEDFTKAIQLCKDGKSMLESFQMYNCVKELGSKLNDTMLLIGERVDNAIARMCMSYNPVTYSMLRASYIMMNRTDFDIQALTIFNAYHKSSMDELKMFLDNEPWEALPVKHDFKLVHLREFSFLRTESNRPAIRFSAHESDSIEDDIEPELHRDFVDDDRENYMTIGDDEEEPVVHKRYLLTETSGPVLTNSSLNVLRLFGRYIRLMTGHESIAYEILMRIYNLLDHYIYVVYKRFGPDREEKSEDPNSKLRAALRSIRESLIGGSQNNLDRLGNDPVDDPGIVLQQGAPNIHQIITNDLLKESETTLDESSRDVNKSRQKAVAIESLITLVNQLWNLQEYLESLIPPDKRPQLKNQFVQNNSIVPDFLKARAELNFETSPLDN